MKGAAFTVHKALPLVTPSATSIVTGSTASLKDTAAFSIYGAGHLCRRAGD